ncbi:MAG: LysE family translocator [Streptosporangiaceae bacterium]|nr:LysE family translocator [Streptosporangiaceae bacterium]
MSLSRYGEFLAFAIVIILIPGPDFAVVTKNTLVGGRQRGGWTASGVSSSNLLQGMAAVTGLSAIILRAEPVFQAIKWAGVCYLAYLGIQAVRSAIRGEYTSLDNTQMPGTGVALAGWRQGFVSNITNPKVLVFFLAVLPQFLPSGVGFGWVLLIGSTFSILGMAWLFVIVAGMHGLRTVLARRKVRCSLDATTGAVLLGFSAKLATQHV